MSPFKKISRIFLFTGVLMTTFFYACKKDSNPGGDTPNIPPPAISSFTPTSGATGTTVTITGTNFTGATGVKFGTTAATSFTLVNANTITAIVGTGSTGKISITTAGGTSSSSNNFTYITTPPAIAPTITSFTPTSGTTGTSVTITGTNFTGTTAVKFGSVNAASFNVVSATSITAVVGVGATGKVSVTNAVGTATSTGDFTFTVPPTNSITSKISGDAELTQLNTGVGIAQLGGTLNGTGPFTLFAPVDAALNALTINLGSLDQATADKIIRYHIVNGNYPSANIPVGQNLKLFTLNSPADSIFVTKLSNGVIYVNGNNIDPNKKDISASNGVIHKLNSTNGILLQPTSNVYDQLKTTGYDSIFKLINRASIADANLVNMISKNVITFVAPTNQAFVQFFSAQPSVKEINQLTPAAALNLIKDHILLSRNFFVDLLIATNAGTGISGYGGGNLKIAASGNPTYPYALYYVTSAAVLLENSGRMCHNGVLYKVGGILTK
ncbi:MAG: fasciclin domain-containing protein [Bacteroidota bacterium]|jgi:uncharacterized surface protein with fasciclin (FAS1) repeats